MTCYKPNMQRALDIGRAYARRESIVRVRFQQEAQINDNDHCSD